MKKILITVSALLFVSGLMTTGVMAKCYTFTNESEIKVCVPGDSFSDRTLALEICKKAKGSDCGNVSSTSSSCHSNSGKCYDQNGNASRSLSGY